MQYLSYTGTARYNSKQRIFEGEVIGAKDVVTFQGRTPEELEQSFKQAVDDYLARCQAEGRTPERTYSGRFNLRISPDLHRKIFQQAAQNDLSINQYIVQLLEQQI